MTHDLKTLPEYFDAVAFGMKTFEVRKNDRDFKAGDTINLFEWYQGTYTGRKLTRYVSYIYYGDGTYGLPEGWCVMALKQGRII